MNLKSTSKSGFTLVELLVTILIIVILSVTMLPLLKPFVTQAQYSAEGVPVIGNLRTKVELFRIENDYLPGVPINAKGEIVSGSVAYGTSTESQSDEVSGFNANQWMDVVKEGTEMKAKYYVGDGTTSEMANLQDHVWKRISVNYSDLTGKKLRPKDMQYVVIKSDGDNYYWAVSCFGHGNGGLASGCGYAVAEYNCPSNSVKFVATFENYKPVSTEPLQLSIDVNKPTSKEDMLKEGTVWLPDPTKLQALSDYDTMVGNMREMGWQVN